MLAAIFVAVCFSTPVEQLASLPSKVRMLSGYSTSFDLGLPAMATVETSGKDVLSVNGQRQKTIPVQLDKSLHIETKQPGEAEIRMKLFGIVPFKSMHVDVIPSVNVIPGGQSIGVKLRSNGILVVGYNLVRRKGDSISPGEQSNIRIGDTIVKIDGHSVTTVEQAGKWIREAGEQQRPLQMTIMRHHEVINCKVIPQKDAQSQTYRIGLYIRDSAAGVGTLTFYDPDHHVFGALGHVISDADTGQPFHGNGQIIHATVTSIDKGESGQPGEKRSIFVDEDKIVGRITKNSDFGVFGTMQKSPDQSLIGKAIPIALAEQVHEGSAKILTVLNGQRVQAFDIDIVNVMKQGAPATKSMVIKVTDQALLAKTGGIIQGMSGSPIIQDGKLVGAVTHVFVNDPTKGYGVYIEWMLNEAGVQTKAKQSNAQASGSYASLGLAL